MDCSTTLRSGANGATTLTDGTKSWAANRWTASPGVLYSVRNATQGWGSAFYTFTSNTITPQNSAFGQSHAFNTGDAYQIRRALVCIDQPGSDTWPGVEHQWLTPAVAALQSGRIKRLDLSAAERRFSIGRGAALRFWRRPRPWWESFEIKGGELHDIER